MAARLFLTLALCFPVWAEAAAVVAGQLAPAIELPLLTVQSQPSSTSLAALRGKVVYLDFWASWCGPCRKSFPLLEQLRQQLGSKGFEVLAVNVDEFEDDALQFLAEIPVSYPVVRDGSGATPKTYGILGMPTAYLIDRDGVVRLVHAGFKASDAEKLRVEIIKLLEE
jgi:thiol-disulfide isomerase/thioredoxin